MRELAALTALDLSGTSLTTLQSGDFAGLTGLTTLTLPSTVDLLSYSPYLRSSLTSLAQLNGAAYTRPSPPGPPTGLTGTFTVDRILLSWTAPTTGGAPTSYRIWRQTGAGLQEIYVADTYETDGAAVTHTDAALTVGQTYTYRVQALNAGGASAPSDAAVVPTFESVNICNRTNQVQRAILAWEEGIVTNCALVPSAHLASITVLNLVGEAISSLQPHDFAGLTGLVELDLGANPLRALPAGVFDDLSSLTILDMDHSRLRSLPAGIFDNLTQLTYLDLCFNYLETLTAGIFDKLTKLTHLELYLNRLESLPAGVFDKLTKLRTLLLYRNALTALPVGIFDNLVDLTDLRLHRNALSALPAGVFDSLTKLRRLDLHENSQLSHSPYLRSPLSRLVKLDGASYTRPLPPGAPTNLTATVRADGIELRWTAPATGGRPTSYRILRQTGASPQELEVYVADTYETSGAAVAYTDTGVTSGQTYRYQVQALNARGKSAPSNMADRLWAMEMNICDRTGPVRAAILAAVSSTACASVSVSELEALTTLDLSGASLTTLQSGDFAGLTGLTGLDLSNNALTTLPAGVFDDLSALTTLDLRDNPALMYSSATLHPLTGLTQLNGASYIPPVPATPTNLRATVRPRGIVLTWTAPATGGRPTGHRILRGSGPQGPMDVVATTSGMAETYTDATVAVGQTYRYSVQALNAGGSSDTSNVAQAALTPVVNICDRTRPVRETIMVESLPPTCASFPAPMLEALTALDLSGQHMPALQAHDFVGLTGLTTLNLREANLKKLPATVFDTLPNLTELDLHDNNLRSLPAGVFDRLTKLRTLDLSDNALPGLGLPAGIFGTLTELRTLNLSNNALGSLRADAFTALTRLTTLDLSLNIPLRSLPAGVFTGLSRLTTLWLNNRFLSYSPYLLSPLTSLAELSGTVYTRPSRPGPPTNLRATVSPDGIVLTWDAPATGDPPTSYRIWRQGTVYVADTYATGGAAVTHTDTDVTVGQRYTYRVAALNAGGESAPSAPVAAQRGTTPPNPPGGRGGGSPSRPVCARDLHGNTAARATAIALDTWTAGALCPAEDVDYFTVTAPGRGLLFVATGEVHLHGTIWQSGVELASGPPGSGEPEVRLGALVEAGPVVIALEAHGRATGDYDLRVIFVRGFLENPGEHSFQSGIGVLSGWVCAAGTVAIEIETETGEVKRQGAAYGTERLDTEPVCGDANNGFGLLFNWNLLGDGEHTVMALVDGVEVDRATVTVTTLGEEFVEDAVGETVVEDFPSPGEQARLVWQPAQQNFVLAPLDGELPPASPPSPAGGPTGALENPGPASFQSGIRVLSGWVCDADVVELEINGGPRIAAAYGTDRADTARRCGDTDNGFGLLFNWNLLGDGEHTAVALADGEEFGRATFVVTTLGEEFVEDAAGEAVVVDFPAAGEEVRLRWQPAQQNFVIIWVE